MRTVHLFLMLWPKLDKAVLRAYARAILPVIVRCGDYNQATALRKVANATPTIWAH